MHLRSIRGLGPVKATVSTTPLATLDGDIFNSARAGSRNVVIDIGFKFGSDIEQLRRKTFTTFPVKTRIDLTIETTDRVLTTYGYVESNEPSYFEALTGTQISVICPDAYFRDGRGDGYQETRLYGTTSLFEFPFSNESLTTRQLVLSEVQKLVTGTLLYRGDSTPGIEIRFDATGVVHNPVFHNVDQGSTIRIESSKIPGGIIAGDQITINTTRGNKYARLSRNGTVSNIMHALGTDIQWMTIEPGDNTLAYTADSGVGRLTVTVTNPILYEGV